MTTATTSLTDFLLARIAEDEEIASRAGTFEPWSEKMRRDNYGHLTIQPDRVLAECEAKRRIVEDFQHLDADYHVTHSEFTEARQFQALVALGHVALPYADHPDYNPDWRP